MRCARNRSCGLALAAATLFASCDRTPAAAPPPPNSGAAATAADAPLEGTATHGDHNPHHGGVVFMKGNDLHYEVVLDATGRAHQVYFSDALREPLPAAVATDVVLTIKHPSEDRIAMQIDETGESWIGSGRPVQTPADAAARLAFAVDREPYFIDIPFLTPAARQR